MIGHLRLATHTELLPNALADFSEPPLPTPIQNIDPLPDRIGVALSQH